VLSQHGRMDSLAATLVADAAIHRLAYVNTYDRTFRVASSMLARKSVYSLSETFRAIRPDIIHINKQNVEDGLDLLRAARRSGLPHVTTIHITRSMGSLGARGWWIRDVLSRRVLAARASHYLTIAASCRTQLSDFLDCRAAPAVHMVRNGVAAVASADRAAVRKDWNCRPRDIVLGCVARIEQQKNPLFLIELLAGLPENVRAIWVGDGRLRSELEAAAARAGVSHRLCIEGWRSDARNRMAGFDIFVLPSHYEGLPLAILEAMAAGLPCVVSDADGTREAVIDGQQGRVLPPGDISAWLAGISPLIVDGSLRARYGAAALARYREQFSLEAMTKGTVDVYRNVIAQFSR